MYNLLMWLMSKPEYNYEINKGYYCAGRWGQVPGCVLALALVVLSVVPAFAASLVWDRNTEPDLDHYNVYGCLITGCTVVQQAASKQGPPVPQPAVGTSPAAPLPVGQGKLAVSAVDSSGNESGLSVSVPFDAFAPSIPANPHIQ